MLTDERINEIAESMPGGMDGFLKGWGWQQFARAIEEEGRKEDEALIRQLRDALEVGHEAAMQVASEFHAAYKGHRPETHAALDADVERIAQALTAARARLGEKE